MGRKQEIRAAFRDAVFERDGHTCRICGATGQLDAHHITDRSLMPNGGYVKENGISLCPAHHLLAEEYHARGVAFAGFAPDDLYRVIGSSYERAFAASERL